MLLTHNVARVVMNSARFSLLSILGLALAIGLSQGSIATAQQVRTQSQQVEVADEGQEFKSLFDGMTMTGWTGDTELWSVADGAIVGTTDNKTLRHNSFLSLEGEYADFTLRLKFKLRNHNSGVQYRSKQFDDFVVRGYQADIAVSRYTGILYEEGGRGILADVDPAKVNEFYKLGEWNDYEIIAQGNKVTHKLNGQVTIEFTDIDAEHAPTKGIIALQLHAGEKMRVEFKDLQIQEHPANAK